MIRVAFTLVELLVVISIIVLLLALIAPALDKSVYEAQLVRCAAQQKGAAGGPSITRWISNAGIPREG
jgi:prepilin-type N-terminal cleavage/methylation domain-containing protein